MKKLIALLLALVMVFGLVACGGETDETEPEVTDSVETTEGDEAAAAGSVYYLNFKPEFDEALQGLAADYTAETGVEVKVVTAASGTYSDTLTAEMGKDEAPTIFNIGNLAALADWDDYAMDLTGSAVVGELSTDSFSMYNGSGELKAIGTCYESFGIIVNTALLETAGYTLDDITNFETLKAVAEDIHARADELGFDAFSSAGLDSSSSWRFSGHLANMPLYYEYEDMGGVTEIPATIQGTYLDNYRNIWDLYINNASVEPASLTTSTSDESVGQFKEGKAVFYQNGTWEYAGLIEAGMTDDQLAMIPIYCGVEGEEEAGLCSGTENHWAINAKASAEDQQASLDFLYWLVTDEEAAAVMVEQLGAIPYKAAPASSNKFLADGTEMVAEGKYTVDWAFNDPGTPNVDSWRATVVTALAAYSADPSDANWEAVETAFVDGWAIEYTTVYG